MELRVAKELIHIEHWLELAEQIVQRGKSAYERDELVQEAGDAIMIKLGEAAKTLAARGVQEPPGVRWSDAARNREKLVHHYAVTDRQLTWQALAVSLPAWKAALAPLFLEAQQALNDRQ